MKKMKIKIYQNDRETYFWTVDESKEISNICPDFNYDCKNSNEPYELNFVWKNNEIIIARNFKHDFIDGNYGFIKGLNVIVITDYVDAWINIVTIQRLINLGDEYQFLIVNKNIEDYWICDDNRHNDHFLIRVSNASNLKIIWDSYFSNYPNFFFEPKAHIQNYYNNNHFMGSLFLNGSNIFHNEPNKKRIGIHFNKLSDEIRKIIVNKFKDYEHENLFFTVNKDCFYNDKNGLSVSDCNVKDSFYSPNLISKTLPSNFYIEQFTNLTIKSQVEVIYETFTTVSLMLSNVKWNEKTIKHLFLGKPFIHMDPVAHKLMEINGFIPYKSLFNDELWNVYETTNPNELLVNKEIYWSDLLIKNIEWLLNLNNEEWNERIGEANRVAEINRQRCHDLIFNTSLLKYVK